MDIDYGLLVVTKVIFHEVPRHSSKPDAAKPTLSEIESPTDADIRGMLRQRLIETAGNDKRGMPIEFAPDTESPVPKIVMDYTDSPSADLFVESSQAIANHLYSSQGTISPPGLVAVIECTVDGLHALAILKIEKEE